MNKKITNIEVKKRNRKMSFAIYAEMEWCPTRIFPMP